MQSDEQRLKIDLGLERTGFFYQDYLCVAASSLVGATYYIHD